MSNVTKTPIIKNDVQHANALRIVERLMNKIELSDIQKSILENFSSAINKYENVDERLAELIDDNFYELVEDDDENIIRQLR